MAEFWASLEKFSRAVREYKKNTGRTPVLVIDDVNNFCATEMSKEFILQLQLLAKQWAVSKIRFHLIAP